MPACDVERASSWCHEARGPAGPRTRPNSARAPRWHANDRHDIIYSYTHVVQTVHRDKTKGLPRLRLGVEAHGPREGRGCGGTQPSPASSTSVPPWREVLPLHQIFLTFCIGTVLYQHKIRPASQPRAMDVQSYTTSHLHVVLIAPPSPSEGWAPCWLTPLPLLLLLRRRCSTEPEPSHRRRPRHAPRGLAALLACVDRVTSVARSK